eukprot:TRINITY_DN22477_c0_g1_i1.p1 TRINITY_DN22477_c0_g1~~TRINITY_DN22477_c0_g1_i1.p1  ORF type:complete len:141 (-),score=21.17 TRINITY_DN22477_c0_g1_i1:74-496(-)
MSKKVVVPNDDAFKRMNFLHQASHVMFDQNPNLSRFFNHTLKKIASRQVLRIDPSMKRGICKGCNILLVPGTTSNVRIRAKRGSHHVVTCKECGRFKRYPLLKETASNPVAASGPTDGQSSSEKQHATEKQDAPEKTMEE